MSEEQSPRQSGYNGLYLMLGNMQGDIKAVLAAFTRAEAQTATRNAEVDHRINSHADRITELERFRWKLAGVAMLWPTILVMGGWLVNAYF